MIFSKYIIKNVNIILKVCKNSMKIIVLSHVLTILIVNKGNTGFNTNHISKTFWL